jgi:hypothetical protein
VPLIIADDFYDNAGASLPECSLSLLMPAASWSARNSKSGFVPSWLIAKLSSDPDRSTGPLYAARIARRGKGGGMHIVPGNGITVVNADDAAEQEERIREQGRIRAKRKRDRDKAARAAAEAVTRDAGVTSPSPMRDVTQTKGSERKKPQVKAKNVTRDASVTAEIDGSHQDDQDQSIGVGLINAGARVAPDPAIVTLVAAGCSKKLKRIVSEAEASQAIAEWNRRAEAAGKVIHEPEKFYPTCVKREHNLEAILAPSLPAPPLEWLVPTPASGPGVHVFEADSDPFVDACAYPGCGLKEPNVRHVKREAGTG